MMKLGSQNFRESLYWGAVSGAAAWTSYAIVEFLFSSILPWIMKPSYDYVPVHPGFTTLLFGLYPLIGSVLGGLAGLFLSIAQQRVPFIKKMEQEVLLTIFATFSIILAYTINFTVNHFKSLGLSEVPPLSLSLLLILALALSIWSTTWFSRIRFFVNPWTASIVLIGLPWINGEILGDSSFLLKAATALAYPVVVFTVSLFFQKLMEKNANSKTIDTETTVKLKRQLFLLPIVLILFGSSFFLKQMPIVVPQKLTRTSVAENLPNVLLIVMDTVRADHLSLYGYKRDTTPNLRKFAKKATLYTRAIAPGEMTLSTHASIFTGLYPSQHGAHSNLKSYRFSPLSPKLKTLAEILSEKGVLTKAVVANHLFLSHHFNMHQGFRYYDARSPVPFLANTKSFYIRKSVRDFLTCYASRFSFDQKFIRAEDINKKVFAIFDDIVKKNTPFFIFINYMDAHEPYIPPSPFDILYPGKIKEFIYSDLLSLKKEVNKLYRTITEKERQHLLSQYDGGIAYVDYHLGELIERLKKLNLYENTLIIITADHGEVFGRRNLMGHGVSVYQDQIWVPLIIKYPRAKKRTLINKQVCLIDVMPTVLDVFGITIKNGMPGRSLLKIIPIQSKPRIIISESFNSKYLADMHPRFNRIERAIFSWPFKFIGSTTQKRELYDLSIDPQEKKNLYMVDEDTSKVLELELNRWITLVDSKNNTPAKVDKLNGEILERLKSLGYVK